MSDSKTDDFRRILAVDTSTMIQTIAVMVDGELCGERVLNTRRGHAGKLLGAIRDLLDDTGVDLPDLDLLVVGAGPGSFTGLRIGMASLKGLAFASKTPMVTASSLAAIAMQAHCCEDLVVPLIDARKKEIYAGLYRAQERGLMGEVVKDRAFGPDQLIESVENVRNPGEEVVLVGPGLKTYLEKLKSGLRGPVRILHNIHAAPRAANLALIAAETVTWDKIPALDTLEPNYQRLSDAEVNFRPRMARPET